MPGADVIYTFKFYARIATQVLCSDWNSLSFKMAKLSAKSLLNQVPEFISCMFSSVTSALSTASVFDSWVSRLRNRTTILKTVRFGFLSHPKLRVSQKQQCFGSRSFPFLSRFLCVWRFQAFALASHEAGLRTAAESKSGQSSFAHYSSDVGNSNHTNRSIQQEHIWSRRKNRIHKKKKHTTNHYDMVVPELLLEVSAFHSKFMAEPQGRYIKVTGIHTFHP